jgi:XTP/dITP diphosphohydrolase
VKKELGDLLLHIVLCQDRAETDDFDIADVCNEICEKLITGTHIYGDTVVRMKKKSNGIKTKLKRRKG